MGQLRVEDATFGMAFFIAACERIAQCLVGLVGVVVGLAVGGGGATGEVGLAVQVGTGVARVIGAGADQLLDDLVIGLQPPDSILAHGFQSAQGAKR
ncbi:hypothetical protein FQZ97_982120 [compost metagenome]